MQHQLEHGLILRSLDEGYERDKQNLASFYVNVFTDAYGPEDKILEHWVTDLLSKNHPTVTDADIWVVVDTEQAERIVSALLLIPQVWCFAGVEISVGRVELVATHKDYRHRGLVRALFEALHERSAALGHDIQSITGIPYFYRKFGYAMAVDLGVGGTLPFGAIAKLKDDEQPKVTLRAATVEDIPQLMQWDCEFGKKHLLSPQRTHQIWEYDLALRNQESPVAVAYQIVVNSDGDGVGFVRLDRTARHKAIRCYNLVLGDGISYLEAIDDVMRGIRDYALHNFEGDQPYYIGFDSGLFHILEPLLGRKRTAHFHQSEYAWYVRVPNLVRFMEKIKHVLEQRLEGSLAHGYTGKLHIELYSKTGLLLQFENGKIVNITDERPAIDKDDLSFPYHMFLNLLFGHKTMRELEAVLPDVGGNRNGYAMSTILFPKQASTLGGALT